MKFIALLSVFFCMACMNNEKPLPTVSLLDVNRYAGTWHEIARFDHSFERGLSFVTATYTVRENGKIKVENRGMNEAGKWKSATGVAKVPDASYPGRLKVSFFRPFYGQYWVMKLDADYKVAMVGTPDRKYFWILARAKQLAPEVLEEYKAYAASMGFDMAKVLMVKQQ